MRTIPILCSNEGEELTGQERADTNLGNGHVWLRCDLGMTKNPKKIAGVVCRSNGCGPDCEKFEAVKADEKEPKPIASDDSGDDSAR